MLYLASYGNTLTSFLLTTTGCCCQNTNAASDGDFSQITEPCNKATGGLFLWRSTASPSATKTTKSTKQPTLAAPKSTAVTSLSGGNRPSKGAKPAA